jgi:hypothetical protein
MALKTAAELVRARDLQKAEQRVLDAAEGSADYLKELVADGNMEVDQWGEPEIELVGAVKALRALKKKIRKETCR